MSYLSPSPTDPLVNLYYYRARWYDPSLGRFLSQDPSGFRGGDANLYRYTFNGPTNATDPTGLAALPQRAKQEDTNAKIAAAIRRAQREFLKCLILQTLAGVPPQIAIPICQKQAGIALAQGLFWIAMNAILNINNPPQAPAPNPGGGPPPGNGPPPGAQGGPGGPGGPGGDNAGGADDGGDFGDFGEDFADDLGNEPPNAPGDFGGDDFGDDGDPFDFDDDDFEDDDDPWGLFDELEWSDKDDEEALDKAMRDLLDWQEKNPKPNPEAFDESVDKFPEGVIDGTEDFESLTPKQEAAFERQDLQRRLVETQAERDRLDQFLRENPKHRKALEPRRNRMTEQIREDLNRLSQIFDEFGF